MGVFLLACIGVLALGGSTAAEANGPAEPVAARNIPVCVFRFQMVSDSPEWLWLEEAIADRIITSLHENGQQVLQRDAMRDLAEELHWTPEMLTAPGKLDMIKKAIVPNVLISGTCTVEGDRSSVVAVIVDFKTQSIATRLTVEGERGTVTDQVQRLSAEILAWLGGQPVEEMQGKVPEWTRSMPAAKALYEGIGLYDRGRYAEAWACFRKASRSDPDYTETRYWLGKMYYFMGRYRHAEIELGRFLIAQSGHPRSGWAAKEYLHVCELSAGSHDDLLQLYADLARSTFWDCVIPGEALDDFFAEARELYLHTWLQYKKAMLLSQMGRHVEAVQTIRRKYPVAQSTLLVDKFAARESLHAYRKQGLIADFHKIPLGAEWYRPYIKFDPVTGKARQQTKPEELILGAPPGYEFKRLKLRPLFLDERLAEVKVKVGLSGGGAGTSLEIDAGVAARDGLTIEKLPIGGQIGMRVLCPAKILDLGISAEFTKVEASGAIDVLCAETSDFFVEVDDKYRSVGVGPVGPLSPGKHTLAFYPLDTNGIKRAWTTNIVVKAGTITRVVGHLPMKENGLWPATVRTAVIGVDYPKPVLVARGHRMVVSRTAIQADNDAIRIVWEDAGSIWYAESRDGVGFSAPVQVPPPVCSVWNETDPRLFRDHSGRYVLTFLSDRGGPIRSYWCWSRDLKRWSNPIAMGPDLSEGWIGIYDALVDDMGRFVLVETHVTRERDMPAGMARLYGHVRISTSPDGRRWEAAAMPGGQGAGGIHRLWAVAQVYREADDGYGAAFVGGVNQTVCRLRSRDGNEWSVRAGRPDVQATDRGGIVVLHGRHGSTVVRYDGASDTSFIGVFDIGIPICQIDEQNSFMLVSVQSHPRWGTLCSWMKPGGWNPLGRKPGPFFIRLPKL